MKDEGEGFGHTLQLWLPPMLVSPNGAAVFFFRATELEDPDQLLEGSGIRLGGGRRDLSQQRDRRAVAGGVRGCRSAEREQPRETQPLDTLSRILRALTLP
jgi:hypothetical protein